MNSDHPASQSDADLLRDCSETRTRRSGPGGQHRNKVETAIVLTHQPTGVTGQASERRHQAENRRVALFRLRINLALAIRTERSAEHSPSELWRNSCRHRRISVNPSNQRFPALLAEAIDTVCSQQGDITRAAELLTVTPSQLVRFLKIEPRAFTAVNTLRAQHGLHPLR